ncbi:MAG: HD-GYP domain-containing protein [Chloroflexi bacterium]|nr:HD-GYP domain-containing protein [Chloroflexota bacterium]
MSSTPILAAGFLGGPAVAAIVGLLGTVERRELRGEVPWYGTLYNHAAIVIAAILAAATYAVVGDAQPSREPLVSLGASLVAGLVYFVVNEGLSGVAVAVRDQRAFSSVIRGDLASYGLAFLGLVPLAWLMALAYLFVGPFVVVLFALPLYTTRAAYQSVVEMRDMFTQTVRALASAIDARDPSTKRHSEHVSGIAVEIGHEMGVSEADLERLEWGGLFHDIGKIGIPDAVLLKPGRLDKDERMAMNKHPAKGAEILANADRLRQVVPLVRYHHEWYNGSGYPDRLIGEEIPLLARILAVADAFEAMTAVRPYQTRPKSLSQAMDELRRCAGTQFDPRVVEAFARTPTGRGLGEIAMDRTRDVGPATDQMLAPGPRPGLRPGTQHAPAVGDGRGQA